MRMGINYSRNPRFWQSTIAKPQTTPKIIPEPSKGIPVIVKSYYLGRQIDLQRIQSDAYISSGRKELQSKSVTMTLNATQNMYISVYKFGSVVMFNVPDDKHAEHLHAIKKAVFVSVADEMEHTETYKVHTLVCVYVHVYVCVYVYINAL